MDPKIVAGPSALGLLVRANLLTSWRRLKAVREQSRLLSGFISCFLVAYLGLSFWLFKKGLGFVASFPGLGPLLMERLLFLLFAFLFVLLIFSNLVICYTNFFRNRESAFLLTAPVPAKVIFQWKTLESMVLASWAFLFLIAPLLAAYGLVQRVPWHFYPFIVVVITLFIVLPGLAGSWLALALGHFMDRRLFQVVAIVTSLTFLVAAALWLKPEPIPEDLLETRVLAVLDRLLEKTRFAHFPFLPSYWIASAVLEWAEGALRAAFFFVLVLASNVLFLAALSSLSSSRPFVAAVSTVQSRAGLLQAWAGFRSKAPAAGFHFRSGFLDRLIGLVAPRSDVRALLVKDVRMFWRDTTQWSQTLVLFGLLGVYVLNLRHFTQQLSNPFWVNLVSYLNLGACALNLATLTTRFVYPQFSLEGKRLWIIGLSPMRLRTVVQAKFALAAGTTLVLTLGLIVLSCHMLKMSALKTLYFGGAITVMTLTLTSLACGLGVLYPNFKEDNPGKIVSGFGGTFCLVLSFVYIAFSVTLLGFASAAARAAAHPLALGAGAGALFIFVSFILSVIPFGIALRRVEDSEIQ